MSSRHNYIVIIAQSEMSRNALNSWEKFRLPPSNARFDSLLDQLRHSPSGYQSHKKTELEQEMSKPRPPTKLIVVMAFEDDGEGALRPAFEPREFQSEERAKREAGAMVGQYPAVIAWSRDAKPDTGDYGEPTILFQHGDVPDME